MSVLQDARSVGLVRKQFRTFGSAEEPLMLECGRTLGPVEVAFETYGELNADRSNAILILHALTGDSHAAGYFSEEDKKPGWWDVLIGPGKAFDTEKYFVICSNVIGGCQGSTGPRSINPATGEPYALDFPMVTIGDMVEVQRRLLDDLGIERLHAVAGGSLGGFQALEWALRYPDRVGAVLCLAAGPRLSSQGIAFNAVGRHAIVSDPKWNKGRYYGSDTPDKGLATARMLAHITYLSEASLERKFGRKLQWADRLSYDFVTEFAVESYLEHQGKKFIERFDANSYLYLTKAMDYYDVSQQYGPLEEAFSRVSASFMAVSYTSDWLFPTSQSREVVSALKRNGKDVTFIELDSIHGHDAFLLEADQMTRLVRSFLTKTDTVNHVKRVADRNGRREIVFRPPANGKRRLPFGL